MRSARGCPRLSPGSGTGSGSGRGGGPGPSSGEAAADGAAAAEPLSPPVPTPQRPGRGAPPPQPLPSAKYLKDGYRRLQWTLLHIWNLFFLEGEWLSSPYHCHADMHTQPVFQCCFQGVGCENTPGYLQQGRIIGDSSLEKEFSSAIVGPTVSTPNSQHSSPSRSLSVGKPYKCNYCGRSYKQQSTLEEHKERCHNYLQSLNAEQQSLASQQGDEMRDLELVPDSLLHSSSDRPTFIDRLANSLTKRKRSTPQKFVGEKQMRFNLSDLPFDVNSSFEKDVELVAAHHPIDPSYGSSLSFVGSEHLRPLRLPSTNCISEITPVISSVYTQIQPIPGRLEIPASREATEGHEDIPEGAQIVYRGRDQGVSPSNGCQDSTDTDSNHEERSSQLPAGNCTSSRQSPAYAKEDPKLQEGTPAARATPSSAKDVLRVLNEEGEQVKAFKCEHCRILFLDHVMFTIHMGCHGFRDPFECNICGYHSQDRYEFSSHIVRGEHKV
ncbi:zinc finger protein Eos isoform X6 [Mauremys reevesii]|uniref:zinc finger protein Eos isoform X6 n=1 Tax=Mauremys reevesii TaxID=260615 RepID=UPI00194004E8|nr:zinc finger protein Eos isoform X6 [Mauremys reevesii]